MNLSQMAQRLHISREKAREIIDAGLVKATKETTGRWNIDKATYLTFVRDNTAKLQRLKSQIVKRYFNGETVAAIQKTMRPTFQTERIVADPRGFATRVIYDFVIKDMQKYRASGSQEREGTV